jgi:hypothetical protein
VAHARLLAVLRERPFEDLGFARVDHDRPCRQGFPEVILGLGKTTAQIAAIAAEIVRRGSTLLVTRATPAAFDAVRAVVPSATYYADAALIVLRQQDVTPGKGTIVVAAAGTADLPVAEGRRGPPRSWATRSNGSTTSVSLAASPARRAGAAGLGPRDRRRRRHGSGCRAWWADCERPGHRVPSSRLRRSFGGIAALLGMLTRSSGVSVVNIDNARRSIASRLTISRVLGLGLGIRIGRRGWKEVPNP